MLPIPGHHILDHLQCIFKVSVKSDVKTKLTIHVTN